MVIAARKRFSDRRFARNLKRPNDFADEVEPFSGWEFLFPLYRPLSASVFDHFSESIFVIDEPVAIEQTLTQFYKTIKQHHAEILENGEIGLEPNELFIEVEELREKINTFRRIELRALGRTADETDEEFNFDANASGDDRYGPPLFLFSTAETLTDRDSSRLPRNTTSIPRTRHRSF